MRQVDVPITLSFVDDHSKHRPHSVIDTLDTIISVGVVRTSGNPCGRSGVRDSL